MNYRDSLNLPKDTLPMRADLPRREPQFQRFWEERQIYRRSLERPAPRGTFILHDGPPYSNGDIHMGHAINKVVKDIITRHRTMCGYRAPYVPGWDNHGMPIEYAVAQEARDRGEALDRLELRRRCRAFAEHWVQVQRAQFQRLGIRGDWEHPYLTMSPEFEARIVEVFADLAQKGYVYRGLKPILWCPYDETALAEAELEYEEKTSPAIYVRFPLAADPDGIFPQGAEGWTVIWTTTPWTIPANLGVAVHPDEEYVVARTGDSHYLVARALLEPTMRSVGREEYQVVSTHAGRELERLVFRHPLHAWDPAYARTARTLLADYVTMDTGTGVVHTAPGHGEEDFRTGRKYGLPVLCPVDEQGRFTAEAGRLAGRAIRPGEADAAVLAALEETGTLLHREPYRHNYPHCWRCHGPLIFRTTVQWFMRIDHALPEGDTHRQRCLQQIRAVRWVPAESVRRIESMVATRPDWCLSRQRAWGVGIPAFYCGSCSEAILTEESLAAATLLVRERSSDAWFSTAPGDILPRGFRCPHCGEAGPFSAERDILEVWFDSGSTWAAVLEQRPELRFPADLYVEGSDQHRGWFNSSLMVAVGARGVAPYRGVVTHGFVLDAHGEKMSKSAGNVVSPLEEIARGGADLLRLWVASVDYFDDVRIGAQILDHVRQVFLRLRNTLRFLVGNLADFDPELHMIPLAQRDSLDRWALHRLAEVVEACAGAYDRYTFHEVFHQAQNLCAVDLGAFYLDVIKDRLYCSPAESPARRSAQSTLWELAETLTRLLAPIMPHVAEEVWQVLPGCPARHESVHLASFPAPGDGWRDPALAEDWRRLREVRERFNAALEPLKPRAKNDDTYLLKSSMEAVVELAVGPEWRPLVERYENELGTLLMAPVVRVEYSEDPGLEVRIARAPGPRCARCWLCYPSVGSVAAHPELCARCAEAIA